MEIPTPARELSEAHATYLAAAAIDVDLARAHGVYSVTSVDELPEEFAGYGVRAVPAIVFPYRSLHGEDVVQLRPDTAVWLGENAKPAKYLWPTGAAPVLSAIRTAGNTVLIVEGTKQALAAASCALDDVAVYGMSGCWGWERNGAPISDLTVCGGKAVVIALDGDCTSNLTVYNAGLTLADACKAEGATSVNFLRLPAGKKAGLDDVLAQRPSSKRADYLQRLIDGAKPKPADRRPDAKRDDVARDETGGDGGALNGEVTNPGAFFDPHTGVLVMKLAGAVDHMGPIAVDDARRLFHYEDGVWLPNGDDVAKNRVVRLLRDRYRGSYVDNVTDTLRARPALFTDAMVDTRYLNVPNGLLDWREGKLYAHHPDVPSVVRIPIEWDETAECPIIDQWIGEVFGDGADVAEFVAEIAGYALLNDNPLHKAVLLHGYGRNGKGTFLRLLGALLGARNVCSVTPQSLDDDRFKAAELYGKLANLVGDVDPKIFKATEVFKMVTGGDSITAQRKYGQPFRFTCRALMVAAFNELPRSADTTEGFFSRWVVVPFTRTFDADHADRTLEDDGRGPGTGWLYQPEELRGFLVKAVAGLRRLMERGRFAPPEVVTAASNDFRRVADPVRAFIDEWTPPEEWVTREVVRSAYAAWATENGHQPMSRKLYERIVSASGGRIGAEKRHGGVRGFVWPLRDPAGQKTASRGRLDTPVRVYVGERVSIGPVTAPVGVSDPTKPQVNPAFEGGAETDLVPLPALVTPTTTVPIGLTDAAKLPRGLPALTVDVETTGYPVGHENYALKTVQLGTDQFAVVFDAGNVFQTEIVKTALAEAPRLHAHSATADLVPLAYGGLIDAEAGWERMHDTVIPAKLADPASTGSDPGLKQLAPAVLGDAATTPAADEARTALFRAQKWITNTTIATPITRNGWAQVPIGHPVMVRYAASDVLDTAALAKRLPEVPPALLDRERAVQRLTARVAHHGLRLEPETVAKLEAEHTAGRDRAAYTLADGGIENPNSSAQVAAAFTDLGVRLPLTDTGKPSVAVDVLTRLARSDDEAGALASIMLEHRHHAKLISGFLTHYRHMIDHGDGRIRPTVYTLGADTGRMSCVRPNLQNLPREGGIRGCVTADEGQLLISADFAGVELRVAAALSQDQNLCRMLAEGVDLHTEIAKQVFGPDAGKHERYMVKRGVFGRIYGGGIVTLAKQVGCTEEVAAAMVATLDRLTPGLSAWSASVRDAVKAGSTQFPTGSGRVIHLPPAFPHKGPNYCIQGTARELLIDALLDWSKTRWGDAVLWPVHDEIVVAVPETEADDATATLTEIMTGELNGVRIVAEAGKPSFAWADAA